MASGKPGFCLAALAACPHARACAAACPASEHMHMEHATFDHAATFDHPAEHNNPGLRSRAFTRTSHWVDYPAGKSLDGYPTGKDPVLRS